MEHTKKFVLVHPRFVRPSMRDKVLSGLDTEISDILNSDVSDEIKARSYISALARFRNYSSPSKPIEAPVAAAAPAAAAAAAAVAPAVPAVPFKAPTPLKRPHKRVKVETLDVVPSFDEPLWRRTQRTHTKKKFGSQWIEYNGRTKKKARPHWIES